MKGNIIIIVPRWRDTLTGVIKYEYNKVAEIYWNYNFLGDEGWKGHSSVLWKWVHMVAWILRVGTSQEQVELRTIAWVDGNQ